MMYCDHSLMILSVYLDDIMIFQKTREEHVKHVKKVLDVLKKEKLYLKMSKCEFGKISLVYLGHIVGGGELKIDLSKVDFIVNWPKPNNVIQIRSFWEQPNIGENFSLTSQSLQNHCML